MISGEYRVEFVDNIMTFYQTGWLMVHMREDCVVVDASAVGTPVGGRG